MSRALIANGLLQSSLQTRRLSAVVVFAAVADALVAADVTTDATTVVAFFSRVSVTAFAAYNGSLFAAFSGETGNLTGKAVQR